MYRSFTMVCPKCRYAEDMYLEKNIDTQVMEEVLCPTCFTLMKPSEINMFPKSGTWSEWRLAHGAGK